MTLEDKVVLITGASGGIGAAAARVFKARKSHVVLLARSAGPLEQVARETGGLAVVGDVTRAGDRARAVEGALARHGRIDILVNNAGVGMYMPAWRSDMSEVRRLYELNLFAALDMIQLVTPLMRKQGGGVIVNVSSIAGKVALPWFVNYSASKFALCAVTSGLRIELKPFGIHCMDVCPGYVKTGFQEHALAGKPPDKLWRTRRFAITAGQCAQAMARGIEKRKRTVITPRVGVALAWLYALAPSLVDRFLEGIHQGLEMD